MWNLGTNLPYLIGYLDLFFYNGYLEVMNKKGQIRIIDIAKAAGVSAGTVDRVIHNRGKVSPKVKDRILQVMEELDYKPNIMARVVARNTKTRIAIFIPEYASDQYWKSIKEGIETALTAVHHYGIEGIYFLFKQNNPNDFMIKARLVLQSKPSAVLLAPIFGQEAVTFLSMSESLQVPVVLINTDMENVIRLSFVGTNSFQSGVLAGRLFRPSPQHHIVVLHLEAESQQAHHLIAKQDGLKKVLAQYEPNVKVTSISLDHFKEKNYLERIITYLEEQQDVGGIFISSSRAYLIAEPVKKLFPHIQIIGFDLIDQNVALLRNQIIDVLLNQNPEQQGYFGIVNLVNYLILNKTVLEKQFLPIDIVLPENVQFYLDRKVMVMAM